MSEASRCRTSEWATQNGFRLPPDAPEVLDFYARRSPIFLAARFDATAARQRGQEIGDGTPIHITMPMPQPWVPLRILTLGLGQLEPVQADVYLLTDSEPKLRPGLGENTGMSLAYSQAASSSLLSDLRSDKGMEWVPSSSWLSLVRISGSADQLNHDLDVRLTSATSPTPSSMLSSRPNGRCAPRPGGGSAGSSPTAASSPPTARRASSRRRSRRCDKRPAPNSRSGSTLAGCAINGTA